MLAAAYIHVTLRPHVMSNFPFKTLTRYSVKQTFQSERSNDVFHIGQTITYISSTTNHYEGIEICTFRDERSGKELVWHADEIALANHATFLQPVPWPVKN